MRHKHHKIATSRGGPDEDWNFEDLTDYDHTYTHALDFVLFESAPQFDFRLPAWPLLPTDLQKAVLAETSRRMSERVVSEETKQKLSEAQLGKKHSKETREKMSLSHKGKRQSLKHNASISESLVGHAVSERCRQVAREVGRKNLSSTNKTKFQCLVTGKVSTSGPLTGYQKARGIDTKLRKKVD